MNVAGAEISPLITGIPKQQFLGKIPQNSNNTQSRSKYYLLLSDRSTADNGNDAAIDDIRVYQLPETCIQKDFPLKYLLKAFEAQIAEKKMLLQ
jgi:hypothetical protein